LYGGHIERPMNFNCKETALSAHIHHISVFVKDIERSLELFNGLLGMEVVQRLDGVRGSRISTLLGAEGFEADMVFLKHKAQKVCLELVRQTGPLADPISPGEMNGFGLSLTAPDLDGLHARLSQAGWSPLSDPLDMAGPDGQPVRIFCFRTEEGMVVELIEEAAQGIKTGHGP
jgi:catechol 2,3-dioxygenase-like lactoylglutathione lyase family enzyme